VLRFETDRSNYPEEQVIMTADLTGTVALITGATSGEAVVATIRAGGGKADFLPADRNNAGIFPAGPTPDMTETDIDAVFSVNVNVGTMAAEFGIAGMALYGASKAALNLLTKAWAAEFGRAGVRVNAVNPGPTDTEGTAVLRAAQDQMAALAPAGRVASPEEIAAAIAYLASDDASFMHGAILAVDGGRTAA
jgi:NAD(P)-dependent dehydrogenase (short-subunit alcohol dehydrogenase family)